MVNHAHLSSGQSLYPGYNFKPLVEYLQRRKDASTNIEIPASPLSSSSFVTLHNLRLAETDEKRVETFYEPRDLIKRLDEYLVSDAAALLLFMNGYPSPEWISNIGWKCNIDPEFFLCHLNFRPEADPTNCFALPALPSSSWNVIRLRIPSICRRHSEEQHNQSEIERLRRIASEQMKVYIDNFKCDRSVNTGDSIVRSFAIHDQRHCSLEQDVSLCVNSFGKGYISMSPPP